MYNIQLKFANDAEVIMETITFANVCRLCLTEHEDFSEPLSNWSDDVMLLFGLEVFVNDVFPQQICLDCHHTLMITSKLRNTVYETDKLLKTYHKRDIKPDLESDEFMNAALNNAINELNEMVGINTNNAIHSNAYTNDIDESLDIKYNYPKLNDLALSMNTVTINSQLIIKSELRVVLEKLPIHVSSASSTYCSICLLAFEDMDEFYIHLNFNIHDTNKCRSCGIKNENRAQLWTHIKSDHISVSVETENRKNFRNDCRLKNGKEKIGLSTVEQRLKYCTYTSEEGQNKIEYKCSRIMDEEKRKKRLEANRQYKANMSKEQRMKAILYMRQYRANKSEEQQMKHIEYMRQYRARKSEERRERDAKCPHKDIEKIKVAAEYKRRYRANMTEEQRRKQNEYRRKRYANMTEEQRKKRHEYERKRWLTKRQ